MSLLFIDGFDNYTHLPLKWPEQTRDSNMYIKQSIGRKGTAGLNIYSGTMVQTWSSEYIGYNFDPSEEIIIGFAFKKLISDYGYVELSFRYANDVETDGTMQNYIRLYDDSIIYRNADSSTEQGAINSLVFNEWNYL